jgi:hypothetical protein
VQKPLVLAGIEMPLHALLGMIAGRQLLLAVGTRPPPVRIVLRPEIDPLSLGVQRHPRNVPRRLQAQNRFNLLVIGSTVRAS